MRVSSVTIIVLGTAVGLGALASLQCPVWAQGLPPAMQGTKPAAPQSIQGAAGQLKTDSIKTKDDVKALDVNKASQDTGQVKQDVQGLKESTKGMLSNPMGK
ncbi:MAG TPA: hypothetical protein VN638_03525 [Nitrospiraceae bacterium]|nr:hypothetical protein [Nitrospiraceae bacterium]